MKEDIRGGIDVGLKFNWTDIVRANKKLWPLNVFLISTMSTNGLPRRRRRATKEAVQCAGLVTVFIDNYYR